ncbi:MAG: hypothetical protein A2V73_07970 [candidate division Zixibacteria bacterium RBG_19FT_COMBO_42_43]|nr:MAG: hypothetical protein A2V73_07970 [candidate division Zixibacteria bacterium RBG_19FT_COMBO_42_43]
MDNILNHFLHNDRGDKLLVGKLALVVLGEYYSNLSSPTWELDSYLYPKKNALKLRHYLLLLFIWFFCNLGAWNKPSRAVHD